MSPSSAIEPPPAATPAGFLRRAAATFADGLTGLFGSYLLLNLVGLAIPMDSSKMAVLTRPVMFLGFLYVGVGPYLFSNSLGKYTFAVRVRSDRTGAKPTIWQFLLRWALLIVWPLEALVLLFSPSRKRLGDRLAATRVIEDAKEKIRWGRRIGLGLTALFVLYLLLVQSMHAAARNTEMFAAAIAYLAEHRIGTDDLGGPVQPSGTPIKGVLNGDAAEIIVAAEGSRDSGYIEMALARDPGGWAVTGWRVTERPSGRGFAYRY